MSDLPYVLEEDPPKCAFCGDECEAGCDYCSQRCCSAAEAEDAAYDDGEAREGR